MMDTSLTHLLALVLAHFVGDFLLQCEAWVNSKKELRHRSPALYLHAGVHTLLSLTALAIFQPVWPFAIAGALLIGGSHLGIDIAKCYLPDKLRYFILDQVLHLFVIFAVWLWLTQPWGELMALSDWLLRPQTLLTLLAYLVITRPLSILIALVMRRWSEQVDNRGTLADAGARIGILERFLVLTFVLAGEWTPIGFLLAAKSVLRFGDLREDKDRKLTEYVLLGTMLSFALTLMLGLSLRYALGML